MSSTWLNRVLPAEFHLSRELAQRLPVALVLCQGFVCLWITLRMVEPPRPLENAGGNAFGKTLQWQRGQARQ